MEHLLQTLTESKLEVIGTVTTQLPGLVLVSDITRLEQEDPTCWSMHNKELAMSAVTLSES